MVSKRKDFKNIWE